MARPAQAVDLVGRDSGTTPLTHSG